MRGPGRVPAMYRDEGACQGGWTWVSARRPASAKLKGGGSAPAEAAAGGVSAPAEAKGCFGTLAFQYAAKGGVFPELGLLGRWALCM
jgi:hypothetical protein